MQDVITIIIFCVDVCAMLDKPQSHFQIPAFGGAVQNGRAVLVF